MEDQCRNKEVFCYHQVPTRTTLHVKRPMSMMSRFMVFVATLHSTDHLASFSLGKKNAMSLKL